MSMTPEAVTYFEHTAHAWDHLRAGYFPDSVREVAIAQAYLRPEMNVADVGAGTGFLTAGLAPRVRRVYALDGSPAMLAVAQTNLSAWDNVVYQVADATQLPLEDGSLDAVLGNMVLHHCPDPVAALREMVRVLRPGGRLVLTDLDHHTHDWLRQEMADVWLGFDRGQIKQWLREAGLVNVLVQSADCDCCAASSADPQLAADISIFVASASRPTPGVAEAVQASYGALAQQTASDSSAGCCASNGCGCQGNMSAEAPTFAAEAATCCAPDSCSCQGNTPADAPTFAAETSTEVVLYETGYAPEVLETLPASARQLTLGCGNPIPLADLQPGEVVLDIGSGAGLDAFYAAQQVGSTGRVLGVDMTPAMIERAQQTAQAAGLSQVTFLLGRAEAMPVPDASVDVVLSNCVINLAADKGLVLEEAYRVLKPGGRLSISDMVTDRPVPPGQATAWAGCVQGALPEAEYLALVRQAGFVEVTAGRSLSGGRWGEARVYSLAVTARKGLD